MSDQRRQNEDSYRLWVNAERTLLVRQWPSGVVEVAERDSPGATWGPPIESSSLPSWVANLLEERVA